MARRHVREAEERVKKFQRMVDGARERGQLASASANLLAMFEKTLAEHRASLDLLQTPTKAGLVKNGRSS